MYLHDRSTAKKFLAAANFLEVLKIFPKSEMSESVSCIVITRGTLADTSLSRMKKRSATRNGKLPTLQKLIAKADAPRRAPQDHLHPNLLTLTFLIPAPE